MACHGHITRWQAIFFHLSHSRWSLCILDYSNHIKGLCLTDNNAFSVNIVYWLLFC